MLARLPSVRCIVLPCLHTLRNFAIVCGALALVAEQFVRLGDRVEFVGAAAFIFWMGALEEMIVI